MQLILETEPNIDINKDMAKLNEQIDDKLITNTICEETKSDTLEINKENVQSHDNVETLTGDDQITEQTVTEETDVVSKIPENSKLPSDNEILESVEDVNSDIARTESVDVENGLANDEKEEAHEDEEIDKDSNSACVNENICVELDTSPGIEQCENNDELEKLCNENGVANTDDNGEHMSDIEVMVKSSTITESEAITSNITSIKVDGLDKESDGGVIDDFEVDNVSNNGEEIDLNKIANELNSDEETNVANDDSITVDISGTDVISDNKVPVNDIDCVEVKEDTEISETNDKCLSNDGTESGYVTAVPSVDDQQNCIIKESIPDNERKLHVTEPNIDKSTMETDDISETVSELQKTAENANEESIDIPLIDGVKNNAVIELDNILDVDDNIEDLDHENKEVVHIAQTASNKLEKAPLIEQVMDVEEIVEDSESAKPCDNINITSISDSKKLATDVQDEVMDLDDEVKYLDQDNEESCATTMEPLISEHKKSTADLPDKVIDVDLTTDNAEETEEIEKNTVSVNEKPVEDTIININEELKQKEPSMVCKLSNNLNILSDDEEEPPEIKEKSESLANENISDKKSINIDDDDDIMLIDEDTNSKDSKTESRNLDPTEKETLTPDSETEHDNKINNVIATETDKQLSDNKDNTPDLTTTDESPQESEEPEHVHKMNGLKPLLPENFLKSAKKNLADMTRHDLEEFCVMKIVESVVDRSNLNEIKTKIKNITKSVKEYSNKATTLTKQNTDLQVIMKSIQEEQKKGTDTPIAPIKLTRSVGIQVYMTDKPTPKRKGMAGPNVAQGNANTPNKQNKTVTPGPRPQRQVQLSNQNQGIPVPKLVPANQNNATTKASVNQFPSICNQLKTSGNATNGVNNTPPAQKAAEKRTLNRLQSVTVDLTDDEPPAKVATRGSPGHPLRLVPSQNLMGPQRPQFSQNNNSSPRKVYIPISGPQGQTLRPGQYMLKSVSPSSGPRTRGPACPAIRTPQSGVRAPRPANRHPAPLPDAMKQYQPPNWKALPPPPDIKLSKVENGIVISWKIDGYVEDIHEEIASYQLYAYQETPSPPSTSLWKKIGDVKALPLPMACTLTQFLSGFKYFFAVRAIDVRSRLGPFSVPGSIILLNKM